MSLFKGGLNFFHIRSVQDVLRFINLKPESSRLGDKWQRTYDIYAHKPTFKIICCHCEEEMMLRYTEILPDRSRSYRLNEGINSIAYKCPRCHRIYKFYIPDDEDYLNKILEEKRNGLYLYLPPRKVWEAENEEIEKRLNILGYM